MINSILWPLVICLAILVYRVTQLSPSTLNTVPGPVLAPISGLYRVWLLLDGNGPAHYAKLHRKYGPVLRIGPNHISIADPIAILIIYDAKNQYFKASDLPYLKTLGLILC